VNTGSADSYPKITIYGSCSYPFIKNVTTGEVLGITGSLDTNDFVVIETEYGKKSITVNRSGVVSDGFNLLDLSRSDFFPISPGTNNLEFGANIIEPGAHALVQYVRLYGGI
jgi:phage-related protein